LCDYAVLMVIFQYNERDDEIKFDLLTGSNKSVGDNVTVFIPIEQYQEAVYQ
jgi:hypothetical protein